jgi:hypothetical protein
MVLFGCCGGKAVDDCIEGIGEECSVAKECGEEEWVWWWRREE